MAFSGCLLASIPWVPLAYLGATDGQEATFGVCACGRVAWATPSVTLCKRRAYPVP